MKIRERIKGLRKVKASLLRPNPLNWRKHPEGQANALRGIWAEVGNVAPVIARKLADGTYEIVDGHLRAETAGEETVQVLEVELNDEEMRKVLASFDAIGDLAERDQEKLDELLADLETENEALATLFAELSSTDVEEVAEDEAPAALPDEVSVEAVYQVVVECQDEDDQRQVFELMREKGYRCRALTL